MAKRALCIGINDYPGTANDLAGCVNDAHDWGATLSDRGFEVTTLLDAAATKAGMVAAIGGLIDAAESGDSIVITFSGHGTFVPDTSGDEPDGQDEALCPYDIDRGMALLDDEIHVLFKRRAAGVRVVLLSDSCHSGTVIRWAQPDADSDAPRARFLPPAAWLPEERLPHNAAGRVPANVESGRALHSAWIGGLALSGGDLLLSGCKDNEYSYDARFRGRPNGAFTYYALRTLKRLGPRATYADWYGAIRNHLPGASYPQTPQILASRTARAFPVLG
ncbi:MAG: caspase domain-containing protein [Thiotrichales bacterium]